MEQQQRNSTVASNFQNIQNSAFMKMRIDTQPLIKDIKNFLSAKQGVIKKDKQTGQLYEDYESVGVPYANEEGVMKLCNMLRMVANEHTFQGNTKDEHYWHLLERLRKEITNTIVIKCYDWGITDDDLNTVIDEVCRVCELVLTRTVDNLERESYNATIKSQENNVLRENNNKGGLFSFAGGMGGQ